MSFAFYLLQSHLAKATKLGDLDGAIAIRKYIASLSSTSTDQDSDSATLPSGKPELDRLKKLLVNSMWGHNDGKTTVIIKRQIDECTIVTGSGKEIEGAIVIKDGLISFESEKLWFRDLLPSEDGTQLVGKYQTMTRK